MTEHIATVIHNLATNAAQLGHTIRAENFDEKPNVIMFSHDIENAVGELAANRIKNNLLKLGASMLEAHNKNDYVTVADTLEYDLLDECEMILNGRGNMK
jgi:hypothetical protein